MESTTVAGLRDEFLFYMDLMSSDYLGFFKYSTITLLYLTISL